MSKISVLLIFGGRSFEHRVSLDSAQGVLGGFDREKYEIHTIGILKNGQCILGPEALDVLLKESSEYTGPNDMHILTRSINTCKNIVECIEKMEKTPDVIFPLIHGSNGEDGRLQGMLDLIGIPYVGSGVSGSAICMDKLITKAILEKFKVRQLPYCGFTRYDWEKKPDSITREIEAIGYPLFIKPANLGSSIGITKVKGHEDLIAGVEEALRYDSRILAEKGLDAPREIEFSVLGNDDPIVSSVAGENIIHPRHEFYTYEAKYIDDSAAQVQIPAEISNDMLQELQKQAKEAYIAVNARGLARVDFFVERENGKYYLNEINTMPEFTQHSMYPRLLNASGISFPHLLDRLISLCME